MARSGPFLNPSEAARRLGVTTKTLRVYERHGLLTPGRTVAGWRSYSPLELQRAGEILALRALGLSLRHVQDALFGTPQDLDLALRRCAMRLDAKIQSLTHAAAMLRLRRTQIAHPIPDDAQTPLESCLPIALALPWPWGGEPWGLDAISHLTFITGPLGCGKTRLALKLADVLPGAQYLDLDRAAGEGEKAKGRLETNPELKDRVDAVLAEMALRGASPSAAMASLVTELEADGPTAFVIDLIEQGLDQGSQAALMPYLRRRHGDSRPIFLMTRSNVILDLDSVGVDETILYCPANHSPPFTVLPRAGTLGYEAVESCLASPAVRARTQGMRALMPSTA